MNRREFIAFSYALAIASSALSFETRAQQHRGRVGVLIVGPAAPARDFEIVHHLARIGYVEGRNITFEIRGADGEIRRLPELAKELIAMKPDVIVAATSPAAVALAAATTDIPVVMTVVGDPIALGLTGSMSRPTRNITGFTNSSVSLAAKRLELLREIVPALRKAAYLWVPLNPLTKQFGVEARKAADTLGIELISLPLTYGTDIAAAFTRAEQEKVMAVLVESDELAVRFSGSIVDECLVRNLPAMHAWPFEVRNGALISYGPVTVENFPQTATYVDRLLKGAKVADLPFEEPTQIRLAINLRTARSIGISVPPSLLARADEVIE
jgi:putative ABC transport system substrate-binding protein